MTWWRDPLMDSIATTPSCDLIKTLLGQFKELKTHLYALEAMIIGSYVSIRVYISKFTYQKLDPVSNSSTEPSLSAGEALPE